MPKKHADSRIQVALDIVSPARAEALDGRNARLTWREMRLGWHFCPEFDEMATPGEQLDHEGRCAFCGFDKRKVPKHGRGGFEKVAQRLVNLLAKRAGLG